MSQFVNSVRFEVIQCATCGIAFGLTADYIRRRRDDHKGFRCPEGHSNSYHGETEAQRLRRELERSKQMHDAADARAHKAENERQAIAKAHRKMRVRVMNGVCPCCTRTFQNLMAHMKTEHPEFKEQRSLNVLRTAFGMTQGQVAREAGVNAVYVSAYERAKHVPPYAKDRLDTWIENHEAQETAK